MAQKNRLRFGELLVSKGLITEEQLENALKEQKIRRTKIGETIISLGYASEQEVMENLSRRLHIEYREIRKLRIDETAVYMIREAMAEKYNLIPIGFMPDEDGTVMVAMSDPMDFMAIDDLEIVMNKRVFPVLSTRDQISFQIDRYFGKQSVIAVADAYKKEKGREGEDEKKGVKEADDSSPIVKMVRSIMEQAIRQRASDIHFEPMEDGIRIRFRIDGRLAEAMSYDRSILAPLAARIKVISDMDISEKRKPQDGRTSIAADHVEYDVRVSSIPTVYGEKLVMRLTNKQGLMRDKKDLGLREDELVIFEKMLSRPHGIILVTGPTGSGKSTTLYTALSELNCEAVNIVTVEDPVEAIIPGVNQIPVNVKTDMTFANVLRAILRQDPDIIMIGEIRDRETAEIAVQASITGHLVVSTLHTNSTAASIARLVNMGVEPYLIADGLEGVVAQRLVRRLCSCKRSREASEREKRDLGRKETEPVTLYEPGGCPLCNYTGYYGRIGVYELMPVSQRIRDMIISMEPASAIQEQAVKEGMRTLRESAAQLVLDGITSLAEIQKIVWGEDG